MARTHQMTTLDKAVIVLMVAVAITLAISYLMVPTPEATTAQATGQRLLAALTAEGEAAPVLAPGLYADHLLIELAGVFQTERRYRDPLFSGQGQFSFASWEEPWYWFRHDALADAVTKATPIVAATPVDVPSCVVTVQTNGVATVSFDGTVPGHTVGPAGIRRFTPRETALYALAFPDDVPNPIEAGGPVPDPLAGSLGLWFCDYAVDPRDTEKFQVAHLLRLFVYEGQDPPAVPIIRVDADGVVTIFAGVPVEIATPR